MSSGFAGTGSRPASRLASCGKKGRFSRPRLNGSGRLPGEPLKEIERLLGSALRLPRQAKISPLRAYRVAPRPIAGEHEHGGALPFAPTVRDGCRTPRWATM